jgi:hypothetical protein
VSLASRSDRFEVVEYLQNQLIQNNLLFWDNLSIILSDNNNLFVIKNIGKVCGYCCCTRVRRKSEPYNKINTNLFNYNSRYLHYFEIFEQCRKYGYGTRLLKWIEEHDDLSTVRLCSTESSHSWWISRGYKLSNNTNPNVDCGLLVKILQGISE